MPEKRKWHFTVDDDGTFWSGGDEFEDPSMLHFFLESMELLPDGRFFLICQGEECYVTASDTPYVIQSLDIGNERIILKFKGDYEQELDPTTLFVGAKNRLYVLIREGKFKALFNRKTYQEITRHIAFDEKNKSYYLTLMKKKYPIREVS